MNANDQSGSTDCAAGSGNDAIRVGVTGTGAKQGHARRKDTLGGTSGADLLLGQNGNDTLGGAAGNDKLSGGTGSDTFDGGTGTDVATDYNAAAGDSRTNTP